MKNTQPSNLQNYISRWKTSVCVAIWCGLSSFVFAQYTDTANGGSYLSITNWPGGTITDNFSSVPNTITDGTNTSGQTTVTLTSADNAVLNVMNVGDPISGTGIPAGTTITSITDNGSTYSVTLSNATTANISTFAVSTGYRAAIGVTDSSGLTNTSGTNTITGVSSTILGQVLVGQSVTGTGIPAGTTITSINSNGTLTLSNTTTAAVTSFTSTSIGGTGSSYFTVNLGANHATTAAGLTVALPNYSSFEMTNTSGAAETITLNGNVNLSSAPSYTTPYAAGYNQSITFGSGYGTTSIGFNLGGATRTFNLGNLLTNEVTGALTNGSLTITGGSMSGTSYLNLDAVNTITGTVNILGGALDLQKGGTINNVNSIVVYGANGNRALLSLNNNSYYNENATSGTYTNAANTQRVSSAAPIQLGGQSYLGFTGLSTVADSENVGAVTVSGHVAIGSFGSSTTDTATLTLASLTQSGNAMVNFNGGNSTGTNAGVSELGTDDFIKISAGNDTNILNALAGGGGSGATATNISIIPWAVTNVQGFSVTTSGSAEISDAHYLAAEGGLVTYTSSGGFQALTASQYAPNISSYSGGQNNIKLTTADTGAISTIGSTNYTINALLFQGAANITQTIGTGNTLTITSGALVNAGYSSSSGLATITGGTIAFGSATAYISGGGGMTINSAITGTGGIATDSIGNSGVTLTNASNSFTGGITVNGGVLVTATNSNVLNNNAVIINNGGALSIGSGLHEKVTSLSGTGNVNFASTSSYLQVGTTSTTTAGRVIVGSGGVVTPGDSAGAFQTGALTLNSMAAGLSTTNVQGIIFQAGSTLNINISNLVQYSSINLLSGGATVTGGTLNVNLLSGGGYTPTVGDSFDILTGTTGATGLFSSIVDVGNSEVYFSDSDVGNNLVLTVAAVPEIPGSPFLILGVALLAVWRNAACQRRELAI